MWKIIDLKTGRNDVKLTLVLHNSLVFPCDNPLLICQLVPYCSSMDTGFLLKKNPYVSSTFSSYFRNFSLLLTFLNSRDNTFQINSFLWKTPLYCSRYLIDWSSGVVVIIIAQLHSVTTSVYCVLLVANGKIVILCVLD